MRAQDGIVTRRQALEAGMTEGQIVGRLRSGAWQLVGRGLYFVASGPPPRRAVLRAALLAAGPGSVLAMSAAAEVQGLPVDRTAGPPWDVDVVLPRGRSTGTLVRRRWPVQPRRSWRALRADETTRVAGFPVTAPLRTLADLLPALSREWALSLSLADAMLAQGLLSDVAPVIPLVRGLGPRDRVAEIVALADAGAQSPLESRVRLICIDGGVPPDALQYPILDRSGRIVARADMAWTSGTRTLIVECDGAMYHDVPEAVFRDRYRQNDLVMADCDVFRVTWRDSERPGYVLSVVRQALARLSA